MKLRLTIWAAVIVALGLLMYQNREFYLSENRLIFDLYLIRWELPPLANASHALLFFLAGMVLAYASLYYERLRLLRRLKNLTTAYTACAQQVTDLKAVEVPSTGKRFEKLTHLLRPFKGANNDLSATPLGRLALPEDG